MQRLQIPRRETCLALGTCSSVQSWEKTVSLKTRLHAWLLEKTAPKGHPSASRAVHPVCRPTRSFADVDDYDDDPYVADDTDESEDVPWDSSDTV